MLLAVGTKGAPFLSQAEPNEKAKTPANAALAPTARPSASSNALAGAIVDDIGGENEEGGVQDGGVEMASGDAGGEKEDRPTGAEAEAAEGEAGGDAQARA